MSGHVVTVLVLIASLGTVGLTAFAGRVISDPYVVTVVRMEALAAGDLDSPVQFTDYRDCVGRLTRAMATFREQAIALRNADEQQAVVRTMTECLQRLADNDLTVRVDQPLGQGYEDLREHFNSAVAALEQVVANVAIAASSIHTGAGEIRAASDDLARRTEEQAASLQESSHSLSDVTDSVQANASTAQIAAQSVQEAQSAAHQGGAVVARAVEAMTSIQSSSDQIAQIISLIDAIAFQTNLLALNAGVEAARAGESGKGFAVVANEVRALAQRSAEAATQIRRLIAASTKQVLDGVALVTETGQSLSSIVSRIDSIAGVMQEIANSATLQSASLAQVSAASNEMDRMTQQNAAMVEQSNAAARALADQSEALSSLVGRFQIHGVQRSAAAPRYDIGKPSSSLAIMREVPVRRVANGRQPTADNWSEF